MDFFSFGPNVKHHRVGGDDSSLETGPGADSSAYDCRTTSRKPLRKDATPVGEFNRIKEMCEYAGEDIMELYVFLLPRKVVIAHQMIESFDRNAFLRDSRLPVPGHISSCVSER
jgi:hypothetical protein